VKHWRTTVIGLCFAVTTAITAITNYQDLSAKQLCLIAVFSAAQFLFGLWAKDRV